LIRVDKVFLFIDRKTAETPLNVKLHRANGSSCTNSMIITWDMPAETNNTSKFNITLRRCQPERLTLTYDSPVPLTAGNWTIPNLDPDAAYKASVRAFTVEGASPYSDLSDQFETCEWFFDEVLDANKYEAYGVIFRRVIRNSRNSLEWFWSEHLENAIEIFSCFIARYLKCRFIGNTSCGIAFLHNACSCTWPRYTVSENVKVVAQDKSSFTNLKKLLIDKTRL